MNKDTTSTTAHLLRLDEAAEFLQISVRSLQRLVKAKDIRAVPIGKRTVRFRLEDLLEYIERQRGKL